MSKANPIRYVGLAALSLLHFQIMATTFNSLGQVLPFMVTDLGMNWQQAGFGFTLLGIACGITSLGPAMLSRRFGHGVTLFSGTLLLVAGFAMLAVVQNVAMYNVGTTLLGLGFCFAGTVPCVHIISQSFERRSTMLGIYFTFGNLGAVAGPLMFFASKELIGGWRPYWLLCAAAAALVGTFAAIVTARAPKPLAGAEPAVTPAIPVAPGDGWTVKAALLTPQFWLIVAAYTGCLLVNTTVHGFAFQHLLEHGVSQAAATGLISFAALVAAAGAAFAGFVGERIDARRMTMLSLGMLGITAASLVFADYRLFLGLFAISMGVGLGFSYVSTAMLLQDYFGIRSSLELYSIMAAVSTSAAVGPGLGGMVRDRTGSFGSVFAGLALIDIALLLAVFLMRRPKRVAVSGAAFA
jgi:cyanate permease